MMDNNYKGKRFMALGISLVMLILSLQTAFAQTKKSKIPFLSSEMYSTPQTYSEEHKFEYVSADKPLVQEGFITLKDDYGKWITMKQVKPRSSEISIELDKITASKPDKDGYIEVTVPYSRKFHREVVSSDAAVTWIASGYYDIPAFMDAYTGNMLGIYHWWDYRPDEDYDPGVTTIEWNDKTYTIYDYKGNTKEMVYPERYEESSYVKGDLLYVMDGIEYYNHIFRIPKDYDGLTMVLLKSYPEKLAKAEYESGDEEYLYDKSGYKLLDPKLYYGVEVTAEDFYFVKISDYIKD